MSTPFSDNRLDNIQKAFARSMLDSYVSAWNGESPPPVVLSGAGGTGKTTSVEAGFELIEDWLQRRYTDLVASQRATASMTVEAAREMARNAPSAQSRQIFRDLVVTTATQPKESASDRKDKELLEQAEAIAFAVEEICDVEL